jgi:hypothetical protein
MNNLNGVDKLDSLVAVTKYQPFLRRSLPALPAALNKQTMVETLTETLQIKQKRLLKIAQLEIEVIQ